MDCASAARGEIIEEKHKVEMNNSMGDFIPAIILDEQWADAINTWMQTGHLQNQDSEFLIVNSTINKEPVSVPAAGCE